MNLKTCHIARAARFRGTLCRIAEHAIYGRPNGRGRKGHPQTMKRARRMRVGCRHDRPMALALDCRFPARAFPPAVALAALTAWEFAEKVQELSLHVGKPVAVYVSAGPRLEYFGATRKDIHCAAVGSESLVGVYDCELLRHIVDDISGIFRLTRYTVCVR